MQNKSSPPPTLPHFTVQQQQKDCQPGSIYTGWVRQTSNSGVGTVTDKILLPLARATWPASHSPSTWRPVIKVMLITEGRSHYCHTCCWDGIMPCRYEDKMGTLIQNANPCLWLNTTWCCTKKEGEKILCCQSVHMWYIYLGFRINYSISSTLGAPWCWEMMAHLGKTANNSLVKAHKWLFCPFAF